MLPIYSNDTFHHRHGQAAGGSGARSGGVHGFLHIGPRSRRPWFKRMLQGTVLLCLLVPMGLLLSNRGPWHRHPLTAEDLLAASEGNAIASTGKQWEQATEQQGGATAAVGATGGRKMMTEAIPLPGAKLKHLILVAGHAVYVGRDYSEATLESSWFLEDYQKVKGEAASFVEHIALGVREAASDPDAMLLFSGGQTRLAAGPRSEGLSYWIVAEAAGWFNTTDVRGRTFTEEHARDSFENLLFSMCRFYELSGHYPERVTVVSYSLKRSRFKELHRAALNFPASRFNFIGSELPPDVTGAQEGEARTVAAFKVDPYGCTGELLQKKLRRDPFAVGPPHHSRCPDMRGLLQHCAPVLYEGKLPWT